jgi:hypothetical protein
MSKKTYDPVDQITRLNNTPLKPEDQEDTRSAVEQYEEWQRISLARLGITNPNQDVATDNQALIQALAKIKAAGAPEPIKITEKVNTPAAAYRFDVYVFAKPLYPSITVRSTEFNLALAPDVVINELKIAGIIK